MRSTDGGGIGASNIRYSLSVDIANRLAPNVSGLPAACHPEFVIEGIVMAKEMRS